MKIGILTFHWATNYGAVLQCFALQSYLESLGHEVKVINYKPRMYDDNIYTFFRFRKFLDLVGYLNSKKKEKALQLFREEHLYQTERVISCKGMETIASQFDVIISGSDQVLNPSFLMSGEGSGKIAPTYFLGFPFHGKRIGYALSFGCVRYPKHARCIASKYIKDFDVITVREKTGIDIVKSMGCDDAALVPDPTLLLPSSFYQALADETHTSQSAPYIYSFFIRHISERKSLINDTFKTQNIIWNNEDGGYTMQDWLNKIKYSDIVVTDSFHCIVMCLKLHTPFIVVTEQKGNVGMNDRLYTLLKDMELKERIMHKADFALAKDILNKEIDWAKVDNEITDRCESVTNIFR